MKRNRKIKKVLSISVAVVLAVVVVILGLSKNADRGYSMQVDNVEKHLSQLHVDHEDLTKHIDSLYADDEQDFIKESLSAESIIETSNLVITYEESLNELIGKVESLADEDQIKYIELMDANGFTGSLGKYYINLEDLDMKRVVTNSINDLFLTKYIRDDKINSEAVIADDLDSSIFDRSANDIQRELTSSASTKENSFSIVIEQGLETAAEQLSGVEKATELRNELFAENDLLVGTDPNKMEEFYLAVQNIKNTTIQKRFTEQVNAVEVYLAAGPEEEEEDEEELVETEEIPDEETEQQYSGSDRDWTPSTSTSSSTTNRKPSSQTKPKNKPNNTPNNKKPALKPNVPVIEEPKDEEPKAEAPKDEEPKEEAPKDEVPKDEVPKDEVPKDEVPDESIGTPGDSEGQ